LNAVAHSVPALFVAMTIFTLGEVLAVPVSSAYAARLAPERMRGRYLGVLSLTWSLSSIVGPPAGMRLLGWNPAAAWAMCGVIGLLGAAIVLRASGSAAASQPQPRRRDDEEAESLALADR
jgi:MFS family permease